MEQQLHRCGQTRTGNGMVCLESSVFSLAVFFFTEMHYSIWNDKNHRHVNGRIGLVCARKEEREREGGGRLSKSDMIETKKGYQGHRNNDIANK